MTDQAVPSDTRIPQVLRVLTGLRNGYASFAGTHRTNEFLDSEDDPEDASRHAKAAVRAEETVAALVEAIALVEKAQTSVLVLKSVADAAAGTVALLGDERICRFRRPSPAAREALRNLATALGWKE